MSGQFKLLAIDMDSTLITIECIDEIASYYACKAKVAAITESAMRGEIDFDESLKRRVALLAGANANILDRVFNERLSLSAGAETLITAARNAGMRTLLVSGGFTYFADKLAVLLGFDEVRANVLGIKNGTLDGTLVGEIINAEAKAHALRAACQRFGIPPSCTIAIGDGANDLKMMAAAGLSVAFNAKPSVRAAADVDLNGASLTGVLRYIH